MQGTSMSAPHVTGVIARLFSRHSFLNADEVHAILTDSADHPGCKGLWDRGWGYGKVNVAEAVKLLEDRFRH